MLQNPPFRRLLVANRGEIAIRIFRAATELGIRTVGLYSYEDRLALFRFKADEAYLIGTAGEPLKAYLDKEAIIKLAVEKQIDAIHPGYGFLSEDADFARLCQKNNIVFIGPSPEAIDAFGDKLAARTVAKSAGVQVIPGTQEPINTLDDALTFARDFGYPISLKAVSGGGGKGIRMINSEAELKEAFDRARSEAMTSFGRPDIYVERMLIQPKHIEIQILGDSKGQVVHLFERDCSIQRRHQKVVEVAPAHGISAQVKSELYESATKLAKHVNYVGLGTVEFLVDKDQNCYFLEVNPRVQVEHTVTEMVTGVDLLQASILVAAGEPLSHPRIGIKDQSSVELRGTAIQCRITTEDPSQGFAPDTGKIIAYRPAAGFGIRLDEGHGTAGGVISPFYDSLLVKVTAWSHSLEAAAAKMHRSLREFRIRGIKHNIPLLIKVIRNEDFLRSTTNTGFLDSKPELFEYKKPRDRATRLLKYIAHTTVNNPHDFVEKVVPQKTHPYQLDFSLEPGSSHPKTAKEVFDQEGTIGLVKWIKSNPKLLLTDTTMRDAHQSLFATRLRTKDILGCTDFYRTYANQFFSLEMWGGATFDTCLRFLKEDPWERLSSVREATPNILLQMLLRGDNAVGYTSYPKWVIKEFIREAANSGLDLFRIFDCLNQKSKMALAIEEVKNNGAIAEVCICYTGNLLSEKEDKYTLKYYCELAKQLQEMGADILAIKDMAGLLRPGAAKRLIKGLKDSVDIPIHLHMHDTAGVGLATLLEASESGCDIIDGAISSMSGLTSQPSLNGLVASLEGSERCPDVPLAVLDELARYWSFVRGLYKQFDPGVKSTSTDVYNHEIPGGQFSNLYHQAQKLGLGEEDFHQLTKRYAEVNEMLGRIIKVTPSSKVVGDFALLLQKQGFDAKTYLKEKPALDYPDSVRGFFEGRLGEPIGGLNPEVQELVLGRRVETFEDPKPEGPRIFEEAEEELAKIMATPPQKRDILSYSLYPKVFRSYINHKNAYGRVDRLDTATFFHGLPQGEEYLIEIEPGKTLIIALNGISECDSNGERTVFFDLNGYPREIRITDELRASGVKTRAKADPTNLMHVSASMPGKVFDIRVAVGDAVNVGDTLLVTESMKMEYLVAAKTEGKIKQIHVQSGDLVEQGDLLVELQG